MRFAYPLNWPSHRPMTPSHKRTHGKFGTKNQPGHLSLYAAIARLEVAIKKWTPVGKPQRINPNDVVISAQFPRLRVADGMPYSDSKPEGPGVCVYLSLDNIDIALPSDLHTTAEQNIAAIADYLELKRGIERRGFSDVETEFRGWKALPATVEAGWRDVLKVEPDATFAQVKKQWHKLAKKIAPAAGEDTPSALYTLNKAWEQAQAHYGEKG